VTETWIWTCCESESVVAVKPKRILSDDHDESVGVSPFSSENQSAFGDGGSYYHDHGNGTWISIADHVSFAGRPASRICNYKYRLFISIGIRIRT
jgi:hypothetical protein